ncbi:hypothetical protein WJX74_005107 [Apatococcus lobatus]|uniref:Regulator of microtubule dynamics protein 1 n=1 Tax=Apatococcus lobatus TaxID=904363 RepID=A0AAW1SFM4_9CHLO
MAAAGSGHWAVGAAALSYGFRRRPEVGRKRNLNRSLQRLPVASYHLGRSLRLSPWQPDTGALLALKAKQEVHLASILLLKALAQQVRVALQQLRTQQQRLAQAAKQSGLPVPWSSQRRRDSGLFRFGGSAKDLVKKGKKLEANLDVRAAAKCYEECTQQKPRDSEFRSLLSKAISDMTYLDEIQGPHREKLTDNDKRRFNTQAMEHAKKAIELDTKAFLPHVAACISMGRLALFSDNKRKCQLAKDAREHAVRALELGPQSDLTHHLMGRWHYEMAQLNMVVRTLIRMAFSTNLPPGTNQDALKSYQQAAKLNPTCVAHHVEIGRCLSKMGRRKEAEQALKHASTLGCDDINTYLEKIEGEKLLKNLTGGWGPRWPLGSLPQPAT